MRGYPLDVLERGRAIMRTFVSLGILGAVLALQSCNGTLDERAVASRRALAAQPTRTPWQQHDGLEVTPGNPLGLIPFTCSPPRHGGVCEYDVATVPPATDPGWGPAPDGDTIHFSVYPSRVCQAPNTCLA